MMEKIRCGQCTMTFRREFRPRADNHRCPDCRRPFWVVAARDDNTVICGISDLQATEWEGESALVYDTVRARMLE